MEPVDRGAGKQVPIDPWALASFIVAIVLGWCPLTGLAAVVAGGVALRRISGSRGRRRGAGLAVAGIAVATAILLIEGWLLGRLQEQAAEAMDAQAIASIRAAIGEGAPPDRETLEGGGDESMREFRRSFLDAIGAVKSVSITKREATGLSEPVVTTAFNAVGERATAFGVARFSVRNVAFAPVLTLRSIEVEVGGRRLALPAADAAAPTTADSEWMTAP